MNETEYEHELEDRKDCWNIVERRYHWAITTLVGLLCFALGFVVSAERMRDRVTEHGIQIKVMEANLANINLKLDRILIRWDNGYPSPNKVPSE